MVARIPPFAPFTYWGLVEFLVLVEDELENLGDDPLEPPSAANQLIFDILVEPAEHQNLLNTLEDRMHMEQHQMRVYVLEKLEAVQCERIAVLWAR